MKEKTLEKVAGTDAFLRKAVENGKRLEALMAKAGVDLVKSLRESAG